MDIEDWKREIEEERSQKDEFFKMGYQSPISPEAIVSFKGLDYYDPDPNLRFELELHEHEEKKTLKIEDTKGNEREFFRWGEFRFTIGNTECTIQAYKSSPQEEGLFIPFRDETSGKETYGAGRYIDLNNEEHYTAEGKWNLDFNKAYNPWCAYSEDYACPFTPTENWLNVPVYAGEKDYKNKSSKKGINSW